MSTENNPQTAAPREMKMSDYERLTAIAKAYHNAAFLARSRIASQRHLKNAERYEALAACALHAVAL